MAIFTPEDEKRIRYIHQQRATEDKKLFFDYFCDKAVDEITEVITYNKEAYLQEFEKHARTYSTRHVRSIPILNFKSVEQLNMNAKTYRKNLQCYYAQYEPAGSYYTSLSGLHVVDLSAIYRNSEFRVKMNQRLGEAFSITMQSTIVSEVDSVRIYENVLYLNIHI